jgi:uncharacterized protein YggE
MKIIVANIVVFFMLVMTAAHADDAIRTVSVDGKASIMAAPDLAHVSMAVQARSLELGQARERVVNVTRDFLEFCRDQGIDESSIRTTGLTIHPQYRWNEEAKRQELQAYLVRRQLDVEISDLEQLGTVIEGATDVGVNEVSQPRLASSREDELHRMALAAAARDARSNAMVLAETLGVSLGSIVEITAHRQPGLRPVPMMERAQMVSADGAAQTYSPGEIRFEANVTARFELIDAN